MVCKKEGIKFSKVIKFNLTFEKKKNFKKQCFLSKQNLKVVDNGTGRRTKRRQKKTIFQQLRLLVFYLILKFDIL